MIYQAVRAGSEPMLIPEEWVHYYRRQGYRLIDAPAGARITEPIELRATIATAVATPSSAAAVVDAGSTRARRRRRE